jgi:acid phosphatase
MGKAIVSFWAFFLTCGIVAFLTGGAATLTSDGDKGGIIPWPAGLPLYDHVVIVIEENKDYEQILGDKSPATYIKDTLAKEGANFTQMYGEEHNSQGNYFWLFSGSNQDVGFKDVVPNAKIHPKYPFRTPNLGASLIAKGYAEDLPAIGSTCEYAGDSEGIIVYARKHVPWISFDNVPNGKSIADSSNLRFADFPTDPAEFHSLPAVAIVVPNLVNDMHNGKPEESIPKGDAWLKKNLDPYYQWAKKNNSLLIVTWDENYIGEKFELKNLGLTNPSIKVEPGDNFARIKQNRIPTIFAGAHIKPGNYAEGKGTTHVNILRTLEAMYGLHRAGAQQEHATAGGIRDDYIITDVFKKVK